jgi:hypothetical protein
MIERLKTGVYDPAEGWLGELGPVLISGLPQEKVRG